MQAPKDREAVICMFCGKNIPLAEIIKDMQEEDGRLLDTAKCFENLNFVLSGVDGIFRDYQKRVHDFKKDSYTDLFESYKEENYAYFTALKICLLNTAQDNADGVYHQIARAFIGQNERELDTVSKKNDKFAIQMDRNMFMAIFVLPAIKEIHSSKADALAEVISKEWGSTFKDSNIIASDYDSIIKGFHKKLCYVTTAVCQNLNMGENCEELRLIKNFRDHYLTESEGGPEMIAEYYDIAPTLVKRIAKNPDAAEIYKTLWQKFIKPCVDYIRSGNNSACEEVYCNMVNTLRTEYMEEHHE